jgi:UDP-GlcNAc:undecaprenyl-phosphate GlcNAc-1-phosphate transferase
VELSNLYAHLLNAFLLTIVLIMFLRRVAPELRLVDLPDPRKQHEGAVPLCGGLAIFTAFMLTAIGFSDEMRIPWNMEVGLVLLVLVGAADDRWRLSARSRLCAEIAAAIILVAFASNSQLNLGTIVTENPLLLSSFAGAILSVFFLVGTVNAFNMLDGIDGLAGASAAAALFWLALFSVHSGNGALALQELTFLAAVIGFLVFNMRHPWRPRASVFMGDAGSIMLGAVLAIAVIRLATGETGIPFATLLWVLVVPIVDTLSLIVRRMMARRSPFSADRQHLHHLLVDLGISHTLAAGALTAATVVCGGIGYIGLIAGVRDGVMAFGLLVPVFAHTAFVIFANGHIVPAPRGRVGQQSQTFPPILGEKR